MKTSVAMTMTGAALAAGVALGWSLRPRPEGATSSSEGAVERLRVSAVATGASAEKLDDAPDPFRHSPPTVERLAMIWSAPPSRERRLEFELAVLQMDAGEISQAWAELRDDLDWSDWASMEALEPLFERWGAVDIDSAMKAAVQAGEGKRWMMGEALAGLAREQPLAALGLVREQDGSDTKSQLAGQILEEVSRTDPENAIALFKSLLEDGMMGAGAWSSHGLFERWAREDPLAATEAALEVREKFDSPRGLGAALSMWGRSEPKDALAWLAKQEGLTNANQLSSSILTGWADEAPEAAADFVLKSDNKELINSALEGVLREWSGVDFDAASSWVDKIEDVEKRQDAQLELIESSPWGGESDDTLAYALEHIEDNPKMADKLEWAMWRMASENPARAIDWAEANLEDPAQRAEMFESVLGRVAWGNPTFAAERLDQVPAGQARETLYERTARSWAAQDLEAARGWVNDLPEGEERDRAVVGVTQQWLQVDIETAGEWVAGLDPGPVRDQLTYQHAQTMGAGEKDPKRGLELSRAIADPNLREEAMENVYENWLNDSSEAAAARAAIEGDTKISESTRWRLLNPP